MIWRDRSCARVDSIKRVVVTSSIVSTLFTGTPLTPDVIVDEMWFSDLDVCKELKVCQLVFWLLNIFMSLARRVVFLQHVLHLLGPWLGLLHLYYQQHYRRRWFTRYLFIHHYWVISSDFLPALVCNFEDFSWTGCLEICRREWNWLGYNTSRTSTWPSLTAKS